VPPGVLTEQPGAPYNLTPSGRQMTSNGSWDPSDMEQCLNVPGHGLPGRRATAGPGRSGWNLTRVPQLGPEVVRVLQVVVVGSRHCVERQEETDR